MAEKKAKEATSSAGHASRWVLHQLMQEQAASTLPQQEARQLTIRLQAGIATLFEGFAERFGLSKNNAANMLIGCALLDAVSGLSEEGVARLVALMQGKQGEFPDPDPAVPPAFLMEMVTSLVRAVVDEYHTSTQMGGTQ